MPQVSAPSPPTLPKARLEFIEAGGRLCQLLGLPRSTGQIYGLLHLSPKPLTLDEIAALLSISKASASTGTRQLVSLHAVRQVWVQGDRRDYFESVEDLRLVLRNVYNAFFLPKYEKSKGRLDALLDTLELDRKSGDITRDDYEFCLKRLEDIGAFQKKLSRILPLAEKFI